MYYFVLLGNTTSLTRSFIFILKCSGEEQYAKALHPEVLKGPYFVHITILHLFSQAKIEATNTNRGTKFITVHLRIICLTNQTLYAIEQQPYQCKTNLEDDIHKVQCA